MPPSKLRRYGLTALAAAMIAAIPVGIGHPFDYRSIWNGIFGVAAVLGLLLLFPAVVSVIGVWSTGFTLKVTGQSVQLNSSASWRLQRAFAAGSELCGIDASGKRVVLCAGLQPAHAEWIAERINRALPVPVVAPAPIAPISDAPAPDAPEREKVR